MMICSPSGKSTKEVLIPTMFSSSSAAWAAVTRPTVWSTTAMAMWSRYSFAFWMISYLAMVPDRSFWNSRFTSPVSAPERRRKAAASKVRPPGRMVKFLVSSTMPASRASASVRSRSVGSAMYWSSSVTSSQAEEA